MESVAGEARTLVKHHGPGMGAALEERERDVARRQLIVATAARIRRVACSAGDPIHSRVMTMKIVPNELNRELGR